jgi:hypothetical protein
MTTFGRDKQNTLGDSFDLMRDGKDDGRAV